MSSNYTLTPDGGFSTEDELYHHGIKGMKWGVRRYQNEDGTLTVSGKNRYARVTTQEDIVRAKKSDIPTKHRERVIAKYESKKTDGMRKADTDRNKAYDDYYKYVENYRKSNRDTQTKYEHDYDHTKTGKKLIKAILDSDEVRLKAYAGAEWYEKYSKKLQRAANKDYTSYFRSSKWKTYQKR